MSGHSKWKTIQHKKGAADARRGKIFSKMSKELMIAARQGGSNTDMNVTLRTIVQKAKSVNMPADNIERAIKKGAGEIQGATYEEVVYEGFAAGGVGLVVKVLTDNKNRAAAEIRHIFGKHGSGFAAQGAVSRGFERKGQIFVATEGIEEDRLMGIVLDAGADDLKQEDDLYEILTDPSKFSAVMDALEKEGIKAQEAEISLLPMNGVPVSEAGIVNSVTRFVSDLEDNDDVQNVYHNMDVSDELAEQMQKE